MNRPKTFSLPLNQFDVDGFLNDYWQKKPILLANAMAGFNNPLSPEELAGLACEEGTEARIIVGKEGDFSLEHGPFTQSRFSELPEQNWTLLVQAVDHCVPAVAELIEYFRFIPNWRIDDVMVSYAAKGGTVGKHFDNYDVFLIQGQGTRLWQLGQYCDGDTGLLPHDELSLLQDFQLQDQWELQAGDILYIPPRYAHYGVATSNDCMTYSIGFRAPSHADIIAHFCDDILAQINDTQRFQDGPLSASTNPGEITPLALNQIQAVLQHYFSDKEKITEWFGRYATEQKYDDSSSPFLQYTIDKLISELGRSVVVYRDNSSRFAYSLIKKGVLFFANGKSIFCTVEQQPLIELLTAKPVLQAKELAVYLSQQNNHSLLCDLFNQGCLYFDDNHSG